MDLLIAAEDSEADLHQEVAESRPGAAVGVITAGLLSVAPGLGAQLSPGKPVAEPGGPGEPEACSDRLPHLVFCRQFLPEARHLQAESIRDWARELFNTITGALPEDQPWRLHLQPHYGARAAHRIGARAWHSAIRNGASAVRDIGAERGQTAGPGPGADAGRHRCRLIREALLELLQKKRRHLLRQLRCETCAFSAGDSLVQVLLTAPGEGYLSLARAPVPFQQRHLLSPFPKGEVPVASDKAAPSRAFAKLVETELRLGRRIQAGETCVDLGAAPGSWTYVAARRGARVIAVDRTPLREDLMGSPAVTFHAGDAFRFAPSLPVDWLLCDVIAAPEKSAQLLLRWLRSGWCRHFVVSLKTRDSSDPGLLAGLKPELRAWSPDFFLMRLCANKKEVCAFGSAQPRA